MTISAFVLIFFAPLFLICAIAVRLNSKGPIYYVRERHSANNSHFNMLKCRKMRTDTLQVANHLIKDPTTFVTLIGDSLRKSSLDELPQLINVIKGEMSIVGPRLAWFNQENRIVFGMEPGAHVLTTGTTGWAQISGPTGIAIARRWT